MRRPSGWVAVVASVALLLPALLAWALLAPIPFGGSVSYVIIVGSSMQPTMHRGDLVIVRQAEDYQVGDIVAYKNSDIRRMVLHRIVGRDGDRYVFKGDNNTWVDSYHPARADLVGKRWFQVPSGGAFMERLRSPRNAGLAAGLLALLTGGVASSGVPTGSGMRPKRERYRQWLQGSVSSPIGTAMLAVLGISALVLLPVAFTAFSRPMTRATMAETAYKQDGTFNYHAEAPPSPVYDDGLVQTGDPVFLLLAPAVTVDFAYEFSSDATHSVGGAGQLTAQLSDVNGWKRTLDLQPRTSFVGDRFTATGTIDLAQVRDLADKVQELTGIARDHYTLTVFADVQASGTIDGQELKDTFAQPLVFRFDPLQLQLDPSNDIAAPAPGDPFSATTISSVQHPGSEKNSLSVLGLKLYVFTVRLILVIVGSVYLVGLLAIGLPLLRSNSNDDPSSILARYGPRMIPVRGVAIRDAVVEVASMEKLAQIAEVYDRVILDEQHDGVHSYLVQDGEVTYRYQPESDDASPNLQQPAPPSSLKDLRPLRPEELPKLRILHREAPEGARDTPRRQAG